MQSLPAGVVFSATNISCGTESEALTQQQALLPKQQHTLCHSEAAHHHDAHLSLNLQKDEREMHKASEGDSIHDGTILSRCDMAAIQTLQALVD